MRYASIDILRTFAIVVMVLVHFSENLAGHTSSIAGLGAPLFAFLSGVSYYLWVRGQERKGRSEIDISKISVRRGLFVFGMGFAFNVLVWLPEDVFNWDVLTFIGVGLLLLNGVRRLPVPVTLVMAATAVLVSPVLRELVDYQAYWNDTHFDPDWTFSDILIGFLVTGYFPIFPWIAFPLVGFVAGSQLFEDSITSTQKEPSTWPVLRVGAILIAMAILCILVKDYLPAVLSQKFLGSWAMYPATITYVMGALGMALVLQGWLHRVVDPIPKLDPTPKLDRYEAWWRIPKTFSQYSLTIYIAHHLVHLWPLWIYGIVQGQEPTFYWMQAMPLWLAVSLAIVFLAATYGVLRGLGDNRNFGFEGWMRWVCD